MKQLTDSARRPTAKKTLSKMFLKEEMSEPLAELKQCHTLEQAVDTLLNSSASKEMIVNSLLANLDGELTTLCGNVGDGQGSVLAADYDDHRLDNIMELSIAEMEKRAPLLFRVLVTAGGQARAKKSDFYLAGAYAMVMRQRSQCLNAVQRMLTATCMRYHAGNEVSTL